LNKGESYGLALFRLVAIDGYGRKVQVKVKVVPEADPSFGGIRCKGG